jgi:hypothetical protein
MRGRFFALRAHHTAISGQACVMLNARLDALAYDQNLASRPERYRAAPIRTINLPLRIGGSFVRTICA